MSHEMTSGSRRGGALRRVAAGGGAGRAAGRGLGVGRGLEVGTGSALEGWFASDVGAEHGCGRASGPVVEGV
jgi:hypothetical protein